MSRVNPTQLRPIQNNTFWPVTQLSTCLYFLFIFCTNYRLSKNIFYIRKLYTYLPNSFTFSYTYTMTTIPFKSLVNFIVIINDQLCRYRIKIWKHSMLKLVATCWLHICIGRCGLWSRYPNYPNFLLLAL